MPDVDFKTIYMEGEAGRLWVLSLPATEGVPEKHEQSIKKAKSYNPARHGGTSLPSQLFGRVTSSRPFYANNELKANLGDMEPCLKNEWG